MKIRTLNYGIITIVQIIMAISVIAIHTEPFMNVNNESIVKMWDIFSLLAVPFFFLICGYFFADKYEKKENYIQKNLLIKETIKKYIKLYLIWNVIYLPITICGLVKNYKVYGLIRTIFYFLYGFFIKGEQYYSWPLWFLLSVVYAYIYIYSKEIF